MATTVLQSPLRHIDARVVSQAAAKESRNRETHLPPVSVFRWWARRTEAVVGSVLDAVSLDSPGRLVVADPFAGGGTIAFASARRGHTVYAQDVNPWAVAGLATAIQLPPPEVLRGATDVLEQRIRPTLDQAYELDGAVMVRTLRVRTGVCPNCSTTLTLYPTGLVSLDHRLDAGGTEGWVACPAGHLNRGRLAHRTRCKTCRRLADPGERLITGGEVRCFECRRTVKVVQVSSLSWRPALIDSSENTTRRIRPPNQAELDLINNTDWTSATKLGPIPPGDETSRLIRHGFVDWHDLYPHRQRYVLAKLLEAADETAAGDEHLRSALRIAVLGTAEFAGYASRWDARYLKPYEAVANHRFETTTLAVEPHLWGHGRLGRGTVKARLAALTRASEWLSNEMPGRSVSVRKTTRRVPLANDTTLVAGSSARIGVPDATFDLVLTDPPYHDDVQYAELSWLFQAWDSTEASTDGDVTVGHAGCTEDEYRERLAEIFVEIRRTLRPSGHLILSYANRNPKAWVALVGALQDAGFRAAGFLAVESENSTDHAKRGRRATTMDLLIDVVREDQAVEAYLPRLSTEESFQQEFLQAVVGWASKIGALSGEWESRMRDDLADTLYLRPSTK